jgi:hypothetical protein
MRLEDYIAWIQSGQTKQAYAGLTKLYESTKDLRALFYITLIDLETSFQDKKEQIGENFKKIFSGGKKLRELSYEAYLAYLIDSRKFKDIEEVLRYAKKDKHDSYLTSLGETLYLSMYKNDYSPKLKESIDKTMSFPECKNDLNNLNIMLIDYYINNELVKEAKECFNKFAVLHPGDSFINLMGLKISLIEHYPHYDEYFYEELKDTDLLDRGQLTIAEYHAMKKNYRLAFDELTKIKLDQFNEGEVFQMMMSVVLDGEIYLEAIEYFEKLKENRPNVRLYLGILYGCLETNLGMNKSLEYLLEAQKDIDVPQIYENLANAYVVKNDTEHLKDCIDHLENEVPNDSSSKFFKIIYYLFKSNFAEAKKAYEQINDVSTAEQAFEFVNMFAPSKYSKKEFKKLLKKTELKNETLLRGYFYGTYGLKPNLEMVKKLVKDDYTSSLYKVLITYEEKGLEEALKEARDLYNDYENKDYYELMHYDLYIWLLIQNKEFEEAKRVYDKYEDDYASFGNENELCALGLLALNNQKDLSYAYDIITKNMHNLYSVGIYSILIKIAKKLNKDTVDLQKKLKESIKNESKKEKAFYKTNDTYLFMM